VNIETNMNAFQAIQATGQAELNGIRSPSAASGPFTVGPAGTTASAVSDVPQPSLSLLRARVDAARTSGLDDTGVVHELVRAELKDALGLAASPTVVERIAGILQQNPAMARLLGCVMNA